jgi:hypothetical protein
MASAEEKSSMLGDAVLMMVDLVMSTMVAGEVASMTVGTVMPMMVVDAVSTRMEGKNGGCTRHTYIDKDGRQKPAHLLIECREFLWLSQALQEKIQSE